MTMNQAMVYSVAQQSHQGGRDYNEDRTSVFERTGAVLLVLADGQGGHATGEVTSQALMDAMGDSFAKATNKPLQNPESFLSLSINYAHHTIHHRAVTQSFAVDSPKTTCVACLIVDGVTTWAHSGDSRFYLIRKHSIIEVTKDHANVKLRCQGNNSINRCVGGSELPKPDISRQTVLQDGDTLLLASDGAWSAFKPDDLLDSIDPNQPGLGLGSLLQKLAHRNEIPSDNLSIVVLFWNVKQLDNPNFDSEYHEYRKSDTIQLVSTSINAAKQEHQNKLKETQKIDLENLDDAIAEIESFISDTDDRL